jgi:hypothetical protein
VEANIRNRISHATHEKKKKKKKKKWRVMEVKRLP